MGFHRFQGWSVVALAGRKLACCVAMVLLGLGSFSCATRPQPAVALPPILGPEQVTRPYDRLDVVQAVRERFYDVTELTADDYAWARRALQEEALKLGADAVIGVDVRLQVHTYQYFPSSELLAIGTAIKYR